MTGRIAVVDGYSTGKFLVAALQDRGVRCVHVRSLPVIPDYFTKGFAGSDYAVDLGYVADEDDLTETLRRHDVRQVVAGTESGVVLTDHLNDRLGTPGNTLGTVLTRRDKALMAATVADAGLRTPLGKVFHEAGTATAWCASAGLAQAVVKPLSSAGTDNVWFCDGASAVRAACDTVLSSRNLYGEPNAGVLVQEQLQGVEYYVNTVSHNGVHRAAEIWRYVKRDGAGSTPVYDYEEPVPVKSQVAETLRKFTFAALDALGIRSSAAHTEVMLTEGGPVLIEVGARLGGATLPAVVKRYSGVSQTDLYADTLTDERNLTAFDDRAIEWPTAVRLVALINHVAGKVRSMDWLSRITSLPTLVAVQSSPTVGMTLTPTTDLLSSPGLLDLAATEPADVARDYQTLRNWEEDGFYTALS